MAHSITAEFILDYEGEEPKRLVRMTLDSDAVAFLLTACTRYADTAMLIREGDIAEEAYGFAQLMFNIQKELESRSLFSQEEFKATKPEPGDEL